MTDTTKICDAIKSFPKGEYLIGEFPPNGDYYNHVTTDQLKALVAENESLKERLNDVDSGMSFDEYRAKYFPDGLKPWPPPTQRAARKQTNCQNGSRLRLR